MNEQQNEAVEACAREHARLIVARCLRLEEASWEPTTESLLPLYKELTALRAENAELKQSVVSAQFFRGHAESVNAEFEADYLAIWKAVKQPELTVLDSVLALKARADALAKELEEEKYVSFNNEECAQKLEKRILELEQQLAAKDAEVAEVRDTLEGLYWFPNYKRGDIWTALPSVILDSLTKELTALRAQLEALRVVAESGQDAFEQLATARTALKYALRDGNDPEGDWDNVTRVINAALAHIAPDGGGEDSATTESGRV